MLRLLFSSGCTLLAPDTSDNAGGAHFLAVESADGDRIAHSTFEQWQTDPEGEMTRLMDALTGGRDPNDIDVETGAPVHVARTGNCLLVMSTNADPVDWLAVDTHDRRNLVYWVAEEWQEDPELVVGALVGSLLLV